MVSLSESLSSIAASAVVLIVGTFLGSGLALIAEIVLARQLGPALFGKVGLAYATVVVVSSILILGIDDGVTRLWSAEDKETKRGLIFLSGISIVLVSGIVGLFLMSVFIILPISPLGPETTNIFILLTPYLILHPVSKVILAVLRGEERSYWAVTSKSIIPRIVGLLILVSLLWGGVKAEAAVIYWLLVPAATIISGCFYLRKLDLTGLEYSISESTVRRLWKFSWPLAFSSIIFMLLSQLDIFMIAYFLQPGDVGNYRSIQPFREVTILILSSFNFLFLPLATKYYEKRQLDNLDSLFKATTKWSVFLALPIVTTFIFSAEQIVGILLGVEYTKAAAPLAVLSGGMFIRALVGPNGQVVRAINKTRIELISGGVGLIGNFTLNWILIPMYGLVGAALGTVCGYAIYNIVELYLIYVEVGVTPINRNALVPMIVTAPFVWVLTVVISPEYALAKIGVPFTTTLTILPMIILLTRSVDDTDVMMVESLEDYFDRDLSTFIKILEYGRMR